MRRLALLGSVIAVLSFACSDGTGGDPAKTTAISSPAASPEATPAPKPASETLAFIRDGDVWLVDADGANERRLNLANVHEFAWISAEELDVVIGDDSPQHLLVNLEGDTRELPFPAGGSWSRDGTQYVVPVGQEIVVFDREGGEVARLQVTLPGEEGPKPQPANCGGTLFTGDGQPDRFSFGQPIFSPDGQRILVAVSCESRRGATGSLPAPVYEVSLDGTVNQPLGDLQTNLEVLAGPRVSPDGSRVAQARFVGISACAGDYNLNVVPASGGAMQELTLPAIRDAREEPRAGIRGGIVGYGWSPESDAVVASVDVSLCLDVEPFIEPVLAGLYVVNVDGSPEEKLVDGPTHSPGWSPSGRHVAYVAQESFGEPAEPVLRVFDLETREVTDLGEGEQPAWQPEE